MYLYHGTKARFDHFDISYWGTGEAGSIKACWFTNNFEGARNHARDWNRNEGIPLVLRCKLSNQAVMADYGLSLNEQPELLNLFTKYLPVSLSSSLKKDVRDWFPLSQPKFVKFKNGDTFCLGDESLNCDQMIEVFKQCGIHGVHDWESRWTDSYLKGPTTVIFDESVVEIEEVIEVAG